MSPVEATTVPRLPAVLADWTRNVLDQHVPLLLELADGLGGPYHVVYPDQFDVNARAFHAALRDAGVAGAVYYAKKANKAACWVARAAELSLGVDVASVAEMRDALGHGVVGERIVVTGPAKPDALLRLATLHGSLITVDALDELDRLIRYGQRLSPVRVLLRCLPSQQPDSRFGLDPADLEAAITRCAQERAAVRMEGFSFHLSGYDLQQRADMAGHLLGLCQRARAGQVPALRISIGGGLPVSYLDADTWHAFTPDPAGFHAGRTFGGFYPYHCPVAGADALTALLAMRPAGEQRSLAELFRDSNTELLVEPGRALLHQAGFTVFTVQGVKRRGHGIVTVDGTSLSLSEQWFNSEFLLDPVLVPRAPAAHAEPFIACVGGTSCLESDMLTWRKVALSGSPQPGDLLVYPNTAGYQMDSNESPFHDLPLPPKVVLRHDGPALCWQLDRPTR